MQILTDDEIIPCSPEEKFSPMKLDDNVKRIQIVSSGKQNKKENQRIIQEHKREIKIQQELAYGRLLQTAAASMFDDDNDHSPRQILSNNSMTDYENDAETFQNTEIYEESRDDDDEDRHLHESVCISPPVFGIPGAKHITISTNPATTHSSDMAFMFASLEETPDKSRHFFTPSLTTPFYGRSNDNAGDGFHPLAADGGSRSGDALGVSGEERALRHEFESYKPSPNHNDMDAMLQRDLVDYSVSPGDIMACSSPSLGPSSPTLLPTPILSAPTPPKPQPTYAPLIKRADISQVILADDESQAALVLLRDLERVLTLHGGASIDEQSLPTVCPDESHYQSLLSEIMASHRLLLERKLV